MHDRRAVAMSDALGGFDAVHLTLQRDRRQNEVGAFFGRPAQGFFAGRGRTDDSVAELRQDALEFPGDDPLTFHDQDALAHPWPPFSYSTHERTRRRQTP